MKTIIDKIEKYDKVEIVKSSHKKLFEGLVGVVENIYIDKEEISIKYGIRFMKYSNEKSRNGLFWFSPCEIKLYKAPVNTFEKGRVNTQMPDIDKVIFNREKNATTVFWSDKTITVVKLSEGDIFDESKAIEYAMLKRMYGNMSRVRKTIKKHLTKEEVKEETIDIKDLLKELENEKTRDITELFKELEGDEELIEALAQASIALDLLRPLVNSKN